MNKEAKFMEELKDLFDKYTDKNVSLNILMNSADLYLDTIKKLLSKDEPPRKKEIKRPFINRNLKKIM